jgi:hypothetical protein
VPRFQGGVERWLHQNVVWDRQDRGEVDWACVIERDRQLAAGRSMRSTVYTGKMLSARSETSGVH